MYNRLSNHKIVSNDRKTIDRSEELVEYGDLVQPSAFRPNLVVSSPSLQPFDEDTWKGIVLLGREQTEACEREEEEKGGDNVDGHTVWMRNTGPCRYFDAEVLDVFFRKMGHLLDIYSDIYSYIHISIHTFIQPSIYLFIFSYIVSSFHSFIHLFSHIPIHLFIHSFIHSFIHISIYSFTCPHIYPFIHFVHSFKYNNGIKIIIYPLTQISL